MSDKLLELNSIHKSFAGVTVLEDISLSVSRGEVVSIIGPSGSGKSTLLRCATMLNDIDSGEIIYMGRKAATTADGHAVYAPKRELKEISKFFGLVFQNFNLFPHYSVLKNIMDAPVSVAHVDRNEAKARALTLLDQFGLSDKADAYPCELSGGQQQRVSIARALALKPEILFFDEPTSA
ncbi:MAG: amino acid ABC transporter ATP-binding protein, partial [Lachnospiraceae bacterium]|nr:amino acid ABC transporter ATP-binding protein [Lachnospiraceae bacterium]